MNIPDWYDDEKDALKALRRKRSHGWIVEPVRWRLRKQTLEEELELLVFDQEAVEVCLSTTADLCEDEMTDQDWIDLGKMIAAAARSLR